MRGLALLACCCLAACGTTEYEAPPYDYHFVHGETAMIENGQALAPNQAPRAVHAAIAAGNRLQGRPYKYGGGHANLDDDGYDCSGTVSYVLHHAGLLSGSMPSSAFLRYGEPGPGRWITIYAKSGHVFIVIAGLRLDTGGSRADTGPQWKPFHRGTRGFILRHPPGL